MAAPGPCGPAPAAIVGAIWITPVSVCHHVSACGRALVDRAAAVALGAAALDRRLNGEADEGEQRNADNPTPGPPARRGAAVVAHDLAVPPPRLRSRGLALAAASMVTAS